MKTLFRKSQAALSLTAALTIAFLTFGALVLLISSGLQLFSSFHNQQTIISSRQQLVAQDAATSVSSFIQDKFNALEMAIWLTEPATASSTEQQLMLNSLLGLQPAFQESVLLNAQDQALAQVSRLSQRSPWRLTDRLNEDVLAGLHQGEKYISPVYIDPATSEPMVIMAVPVTDVLGDFRGSLVAEVNLRFIWEMVDRLKVGDTGRAYVVDRQGNLIAFGDTARVLKGENVSQLQTVSKFIHSPASALASEVSTYTGITGSMVVGTYVPLGTPDWAVVTELPWQEAYKEVIRQAVASLGIILVMAVLASIMGVYLARRLAVPMVHLKETATRIAGGERELQAVVDGPEEAASLAMAFNSMTAQLRQSMESLEQQITEVKRVEESLRRANETLQALIDYSPLAIIMLDLKGHVLLWNNAAEKMYGWTAQEALGEFIPFVLEDKREEQRATNERVTRGEVITNLESEHRRKDGSRIVNSVSLAPLRDATGSVYAHMSIAADITGRRKAEAELRRYRGHLEELVEQRTAELKAANEQLVVLTRAKDEFVSNVSHELRTPISSLKLRQRLLRSHPDQLDQHLDVIQRETDRLARIIEELLQLSRLDQRRVELHPVFVDLTQMVGQYVTDRVPIANDKGLALSFQEESELPGVMADTGLLGQALSILLTNAINYTPAGGQVLVRTHARQDADKRWIGFSIADTGPGIPPDEQPRLFDRFFRGQIARKSGVPGTGLGLAIAQEIVKRHRGNIEVESDGTPGHGATFRVWIPIGREADDDSAGG